MNSEGKDPPHKQSVLHTNLSVVSSLVDLIGSSFGPKGNFKFVLKDISSENSENIKGIITTKSGNDIIKVGSVFISTKRTFKYNTQLVI